MAEAELPVQTLTFAGEVNHSPRAPWPSESRGFPGSVTLARGPDAPDVSDRSSRGRGWKMLAGLIVMKTCFDCKRREGGFSDAA
jgi:hypothetical protein